MAFFELLAWKKTDWDFVGKRRIAFALSGCMVLVGLVAIVQMVRGKAPMGIDFAGGVAMQAVLSKPIDPDAVRHAFTAAGILDAQIQQAEAAGVQKLLIRLHPGEMSGTTATESARQLLIGLAGGTTVVIESVQVVGPAVGRRLQQQAGWAVFWAIALIMVYIWVRFEVRFGVAAAVATLHDVIAVLGIMWLLHRDFTLLIVTSLLTLAGYSLTDTVVVYDRIRENVRLKPGESLETVINRSINEVLSRTLVTSVMVVLPLASLLVYGSPVTFDFTLTLLLGVLVGTYSSWFVAAPIIVEWEEYRRRQRAASAASRFTPRK